MASSHQKTAAAILYASTMKRFRQIQNLKLQAFEHGSVFFRLPGFKYDDFNRSGLLDIYKMDRMAQTIWSERLLEEACLRSGNSSGMDGAYERLIMAISRHWSFSAGLHQRAAVDFPMTKRYSIIRIGRSSFDQCVTYFEDTGSTAESATTSNDNVEKEETIRRPQQPLACCTARFVNVDLASRKAIPLPKHLVDVLSPLVQQVDDNVDEHVRVLEQRQQLPPVAIPDTAFECRIVVRYEDMDFNFHTNVSSYLAFAMECAAQAAASGFYSLVRDDVAFYRAKAASSVFLGESQAGDVLTVSTWEDADNKMLLNFAVGKERTMIYCARIEFYDEMTFMNSRI